MSNTISRRDLLKSAAIATGSALAAGSIFTSGSALASDASAETDTSTTSSNRVCQILGIEKPVVQAMMMELTSPELAAAVSNAGGLGIIATPTEDEVKETLELTNKPFAVGGYTFDEDWAATLKELGIKIIYLASLGAPTHDNDWSVDDMLDTLRFLKEQNFTVIVKDLCPTIENARAFQDAGADIIVIIGHGCGGCGPIEDTPVVTHLANFQGKLDVPVLAAGGIVNAATAKPCALLGAEGAFVGTRFLACEESPCSDAAKQVIVDSKGTDLVVMPVDPMLNRVTRTPMSERLIEELRNGTDATEVWPEVNMIWTAMRDGNIDDYAVSMNCAVDMITEVLPAKDIVDDIASAWE